MSISKDHVLETIASFYLESRDFNGMPVATLVAECKVEWNELQGVVRELIEGDSAGMLYSELETNTHILRTGFPPREVQIAKLETDELFHTCLYPRPKYLATFVDRSQYEREPYRLCLALGEPQLAYRSFDLGILENYRNDPRYIYRNDDINGYISVRSEFFESEQMAEHDQILLESFGFSYDSDLNRAVAVYLRYLANLSPEHQQIWKARELSGDYQIHPDYYRNTIVGDWGQGVPILTAFLKELYLINEMAKALDRPPLFHRDFGEYGEDKPQGFSFLVRPTLEEFNTFVLLMDKMLSDNINKKFFLDEVPYEIETERKDGRLQVQNKGTLQILDDWVRSRFRTSDWTPWVESTKALREIRSLRQRPAHALDENVFDQHYFKEQRELIIKAYSAVRTLRQLLASHSAVKAAHIEIPDWLQSGRFWTY
jgi:hypothetical protein